MRLTRREALAGAGAMIGATATMPAVSAPFESLNKLAQRSGRRFGSAVAWTPPGRDAGSVTNPRYTALLERECSLLVPENQLKWQWVRRSPDGFDFRAFDAIADYAEHHNFKLRGHTLFWTPTKWYPKWLAETQFRSSADAEKLLIEHVRTVCRRYGTRIYSYDVVNEAVQPETGQIRNTNVTRALGGEHFLDLMYHTAREEAPHAQLVYNDYMSWERNPVDEMHMRGVLKLLVTVFDVNDHDAPTDIVARDRMVADYGRAYLDLMLSYPQIGDLLCWGMTDRYSWLNGFDPRADKTLKRGTPYDLEFRPKPLRSSMGDAFRSASSRHAS